MKRFIKICGRRVIIDDIISYEPNRKCFLTIRFYNARPKTFAFISEHKRDYMIRRLDGILLF